LQGRLSYQDANGDDLAAEIVDGGRWPMATHEVRVDYAKTLADEPETGQNRWHPDIPPIVRCDPGDEVVLQTRDAFDGQMGPAATLETVRAPNLAVVHPLTGPVFVNGAEPGDLLEVEMLDVEPDSYGYTVQVPGFGFLRDQFPDPYMARWRIADGWATSDDLPGVRIPGAPFMGTIGLSPDRRLLQATTAREQAALDRGGFVLPPDPTDAVPSDPAVAGEALRTIPPRETAGNVDIKQLSTGTRLLIPVYAEGGLFSAGDAHFAQGDCETCGTAIEMRATLHVRFAVHKGRAAALGIRDLQFTREDYFLPPEFAAPRRFFATTGLSVTRDGENRPEDLTLAARNALLNMIDHLMEHGGWTRQQAYAICSVAVDLKVSELVDVPNFVVSAFLPLDLFTG
jgi:formamidase